MMGRAYLITLTNDEIRMTNDEGMSNDEFRNSILNLARLFVIRPARDSQPTMRISSLIRHSSFVLRHWGMMGHGFMAPSCSRLQEKVAKAVTARPERPAIYHRNKFGSDIRDIFAFRCLRRNSWFYLFARVGRSLPPRRAMILGTRLLFSGGDN